VRERPTCARVLLRAVVATAIVGGVPQAFAPNAGADNCVAPGTARIDALTDQETGGSLTGSGVQFSGTINFGDGATGAVGSPHAYTQPGTYTVTVSGSGVAQVTDSDGNLVQLPCSNAATPVAVVVVHELTPKILYTVDGKNAMRYTFDGAASRSGITSYQWSFSDGTTATGPVTTRTFPHPGDIYSVTLTVTSPHGTRSTSVMVRPVRQRDTILQPQTKENMAQATQRLKDYAANWYRASEAACTVGGLGGFKGTIKNGINAILTKQSAQAAAENATRLAATDAKALLRQQGLPVNKSSVKALNKQMRTDAHSQTLRAVQKEAQANTALINASTEFTKELPQEVQNGIIDSTIGQTAEDTVGDDVYGVPLDGCEIAGQAGSGGMLTIAAGTNALANDPPRPDYLTIAPMPTQAAADNTAVDAPLTKALRELLDNERLIAELLQTVLISIERADGARLADDSDAEASQRQIMRDAAAAAAAALRTEPTLRAALLEELRSSGVTSITIPARTLDAATYLGMIGAASPLPGATVTQLLAVPDLLGSKLRPVRYPDMLTEARILRTIRMLAQSLDTVAKR
jgi:PKD repeat protein